MQNKNQTPTEQKQNNTKRKNKDPVSFYTKINAAKQIINNVYLNICEISYFNVCWSPRYVFDMF